MKKNNDNLVEEFSLRFLIKRIGVFFSFLKNQKNQIILSSISVLFFTISFNYLIIYYFPSAVRRETMTNLLYLYTRSKI